MGRPPTPLRILRAHGSKRAIYNNRNPVRASDDPPPNPPDLVFGEPHMECFEQLKAQLARMNLLSATDANMLYSLAFIRGEVLDCMQMIQKSGRYIPRDPANPSDGWVSLPWVKRLDKMLELQMKFEGRFGFTPSDRARLQAEQPAPDQDDDGLIQVNAV